jgi:hypothetical protein
MLGDLRATRIHHPDLDHTPHVRMARIARRDAEVICRVLAGEDLG